MIIDIHAIKKAGTRRLLLFYCMGMNQKAMN